MSANQAQNTSYPWWLKIILGIITFGLYFLLRKSNKKKSLKREWAEAILFAVIAATLIRTFLFEAFTIPTASMERSLLIGDFLFVSKLSYGPRVPNTPLSFPFVHHTMPITNSKSYLEWLKLPYMRLPGMGKVQRNDVVVFNYPMEEFRPVDKRENYIKRCVGIPDDVLEVKQGVLWVNGKKAECPKNLQLRYDIQTDGNPLNPEALRKLDVYELFESGQAPGTEYQAFMTGKAAEAIKGFGNVVSLKPHIEKDGQSYADPNIFPQSGNNVWNVDNFGPIEIPSKGKTVKLTLGNLPLYARLITVYEGHALSTDGGNIRIDGKPASEYKFQMNYFFMMGDNRHNSLDSRFWGFVPEDHVVGKAVFIWMSLNNYATNLFQKIRYNRVFSTINTDGSTTSWFFPVAGIGLGIYLIGRMRRKKKVAKG